LSSVNSEYNAVLLKNSFSDEQFFYGKGAGRFPTASAVLSDISALRLGYKYKYKKGISPEWSPLTSSRVGRFYLGFEKESSIDIGIFDSIEESYNNHHRHYITGNISLEKLTEYDFWRDEKISLIQIGLPDYSNSGVVNVAGIETDKVKALG